MTSPRTTATSAPRRRRRMLTAGLALGMATMAVAPPAMAAEQKWTVIGWDRSSYVHFTDGSSQTALIQIKNTTGNDLDTYCIERKVSTGMTDAKTELDWDTSGIKNLTNVAWILNHSFPTVPKADLEAAVERHESEKPAEENEILPNEDPKVDISVTETEAVAGTQAAIWHYTDDAKISLENEKNLNVIAVYDYLTDKTLNSGIAEKPATLSLQGPTEPSPLDLSQDSKVGPFTVSTSIDKVKVSSSGTVVDSSGDPVTTAKDADQLYVSVPKGSDAGSATVTVSGTGTMPVGQVFAPIPGEKKTQTLITAASKTVKLSDSKSAAWFPKPTIELPEAPVTPEEPVVPELPEAPERPETVTPTPEPERPETVPPTAETTDPAEESEKVVEAEETEEPEELAQTGGSLTAAVLGAGLLAGGAGLIIAKRRSEA